MSEFAVEWVRSSFCADNACVEAAEAEPGGDVLVRDGKDVGLPVLQFSKAEWTTFTEAVAAGEFRFD